MFPVLSPDDDWAPVTPNSVTKPQQASEATVILVLYPPKALRLLVRPRGVFPDAEGGTMRTTADGPNVVTPALGKWVDVLGHAAHVAVFDQNA